MKKIKVILTIIFLLLSLFLLHGQNSRSSRFLFLGHCYEHWNNGGLPRVDRRVVELDKSDYDVIMLGGDVTPATFVNMDFIRGVNEVFDLKNDSVLWTLGNHDYLQGNVDFYKFFSEKETYYPIYLCENTFFVYDTSITPADCENLNAQYETLELVCDTISKSTNLILMIHNGIWSDINGVKNPNLIGHTYFPYYNANCYSSENTFKKSIYPMLVDVVNKGIGVYVIMGDFGSNLVKYDQLSDEGVRFMGAGIYKSKYFNDSIKYANRSADLILEFVYDYDDRQLEYQFLNLDSLINFQLNK